MRSPDDRATVVVSVHDVAPATWDESRDLVARLERHGMRGSLLLVPGPWRGGSMEDTPEFGRWVLDAVDRGHEPVLHGWSHAFVADPAAQTPRSHRMAARLVTRGCAEFADLGEDAAAERVVAGLRVLDALGLEVIGFTPPGWWASIGTRRALPDLGLRYTTTRRHVIDLRSGYRLGVPAYCQRPHSRLAPIGRRVVERAIGSALRDGRTVRLALHPDDLHDGRIERSTDHLLQRCSHEARTLTYAQLVALGPDRSAAPASPIRSTS